MGGVLVPAVGCALSEDSYIGSFNGRRRHECLNVEKPFSTLSDVRDKLEHWRQDYSRVRRTAPWTIALLRSSRTTGRNRARLLQFSGSPSVVKGRTVFAGDLAQPGGARRRPFLGIVCLLRLLPRTTPPFPQRTLGIPASFSGSRSSSALLAPSNAQAS